MKTLTEAMVKAFLCAFETAVWLGLWATHWTGTHTTLPYKDGSGVWCVDCLREWKR